MPLWSTAFEVRCPRCRVSFPPETKKCLHCGGPTVRPEEAGVETWSPMDVRTWRPESTASADAERHARAVAGGPSASESGSAHASEQSAPARRPATDPFDEDDRELDEELSGEPTSLGRTLLRAFGSLIWVVALIAFTLARRCGEE